MFRCAISTADNPYNPFEDFESWYRFDTDHGYNSCGMLARFQQTSDQFTDAENAYEIERAIDTIIKNDPLNRYIKIKENISDPNENSDA